MSQHKAGEPQPVTESDPNGGGPEGLIGGMGVSSERTGPLRGSAEDGTHGVESVNPDEDASPPER